MCIAVVNFTPDDITAPTGIFTAGEIPLTHVSFVGISGLACGHTGSRRDGRVEKSLPQIERCENLTPRELVKGDTSQTAQKESEDDKTKITVDDALARLICQRFSRNR